MCQWFFLLWWKWTIVSFENHQELYQKKNQQWVDNKFFNNKLESLVELVDDFLAEKLRNDLFIYLC